MQLFNNNSTNYNYNQIGYEFAKCYYDKMSKQGISGALDLFHQNATGTFEGDEFKGSYNWLLKLAQTGVAKFDYHDISGIAQPVGNYEIIVNIKGNLRPIGLWQQHLSNWHQFSEVFILEKNGDIYLIKNYMLRLY
jgi:hypothetical protein